MHSSVKEQDGSGMLISTVLVVRVDWNTAPGPPPDHHFVLTVKMLVLSAQIPVSTEFISIIIIIVIATGVELDYSQVLSNGILYSK